MKQRSLWLGSPLDERLVAHCEESIRIVIARRGGEVAGFARARRTEIALAATAEGGKKIE